jgi:hypothetical protein
MTTTLKNTTSTVNPGYGAVPPLTVGQVYTTNITAGPYLTSTGTGTVNWSHNNIPDNVLVAKGNPPTIEVKGNMVINGRDLEERLDTIEKVLQIPERDVILENKHPKLKKLHDEYIKELSKYRMWETIKGEE